MTGRCDRRWHDRLCQGITGTGCTSVCEQVEPAVAALPDARRPDLDWLITGARDIICGAAAGDDAWEAVEKHALRMWHGGKNAKVEPVVGRRVSVECEVAGLARLQGVVDPLEIALR